MKYVDTLVGFREIPDEITLCINISNCPCHCIGCHSAYLAQDIGYDLTKVVIDYMIKSNNGISCFCFMGGDADPRLINTFAKHIKTMQPNLKVGWYSGRDKLSDEIDINNFDYIKIGHYDENYGPLDNPKTNQHLYQVENQELKDITSKFWKKKI